MGLFHISLENAVRKEYTLREVLRKPLHDTWRHAFAEIFSDLNFTEALPGRKRSKGLLNDIGALVSFGFTSGPHELIHAKINEVMGGTNAHVVVNKLYCGDIYAALIPGVEADWLLPIIGGYVEPEHMTTPGRFVMAIAPYILTPVGIYLLQKAREKKVATLGLLGAGALLAHAGGIIGDWWKLGRDVVYETANSIGNMIGYEALDDNPAVMIGGAALGVYLGSKAMSFTYRLSKGLVGSLRVAAGHRILMPPTDSIEKKMEKEE